MKERRKKSCKDSIFFFENGHKNHVHFYFYKKNVCKKKSHFLIFRFFHIPITIHAVAFCRKNVDECIRKIQKNEEKWAIFGQYLVKWREIVCLLLVTITMVRHFNFFFETTPYYPALA